MSRQPRLLNLGFAGGEMSQEMYSRTEDPKFRLGASRILNMVCEANGSVSRRVGLEFVDKAKDSTTGKQVLFPFGYAGDAGYVISAGRATVSGRSIGHFRIHQNGETLMLGPQRDRVVPEISNSIQSTSSVSCTATTLTLGAAVLVANAYVGHTIISEGSWAIITSNTTTVFTFTGGWVGGTPTSGASYSVTATGRLGNNIYLATAHTFVAGDPVRLLPTPNVDVTFDTTTNRCNFNSTGAGMVFGLGPNLVLGGTPVVFSAASMPAPLEAYRIYYVSNTGGVNQGFTVSATRFGAAIDITSAGSAVKIAAMPEVSTTTALQDRLFQLDSTGFAPTVTLYATNVTATSIQLAATRQDALVGTGLFIVATGCGAHTAHYAYQRGDVVWDAAEIASFYVMKKPYGEDDVIGTYVYPGLAAGIGTTGSGSTTYWYRLPGKQSSVTANASTDRITWTAHGQTNGTPVVFGGTSAPGGITAGVTYFVRNAATNDFQVSRTRCGDIIDIASAGTSVTAAAGMFYEVPHYYTVDELDRATFTQSNDVMTIASAYRPAAELRRLAPTRWELIDVPVGARVVAPRNVACTSPVPGEGMAITSVTSTGAGTTPAVLVTTTPHDFAFGEPAYVSGIFSRGIADGFYVVHYTSGAGTTDIRFRTVEAGSAVIASSTGAVDGRVRSTSSAASIVSSYRVTSVDSTGTESPQSVTLEVSNNLFVRGASNPLTWSAVPGAMAYRVYKKELGVFGLIGETQTASFVDDGQIRPSGEELAETQDTTIFRFVTVTFNATTDDVRSVGHGVEEGAPVVFDVVGDLPAPLEVGVTYYAFNVSADSFQIATTFGSTTAVNITGALTGIAVIKVGAFPAAVAYIEGRRAFGGGLINGQQVTMTASGTESDFGYALPLDDSDRIRFTMSVRRSASIRHMVPMSHLLLMTNSSEVRLTPLNDDALTPTSVSVRPQSYVGSSYVQPEVVNDTLLFVAARGGRVREMGFDAQGSRYRTGDLCHRTPHLFDDFTLSRMAYAKAPHPLVWFVSSSSKMLGLTYIPEEQVGAWHQHTTDGTIESVAVIPEGDEDRLYVSVLRTLGGVATRTIERMGVLRHVTDVRTSLYVDCALSYDGAGATAFGGLDHLEGRTVRGVADGVPFTKTVAGGSISFSATVRKLCVGLAYTSELQTLPIAARPAGLGVEAKNPTRAAVQVKDSGQFRVGVVGAATAPSRAPAAGALFSGFEPVGLPGIWSDDAAVLIQQAEPLPLHVIALNLEFAPGG